MLKTPTNGIFSPTLNNVQSGDTLVYDSYTNNWVNVPSSGGGLVVHATVSGQTVTLNKTWKEIKNAIEAGAAVWIICEYNDTYSSSVVFDCNYNDYDGYVVKTNLFGEATTLRAAEQNDYPSYAVV